MKDVTLQQAALSYANRGWHVFPLQPRSKVPATHHGVKDATTDVDQIQNWWTDNPDYNVGIACGKASNIFVIDEDNKDATDPIYVPKTTLMASTGGGGIAPMYGGPAVPPSVPPAPSMFVLQAGRNLEVHM